MNGADFSIAWQVMKWPLAACLLLPPLLLYLGIHVVKREVIFVDLALAQVATFGTCIALIMGYSFHDQISFWISLVITFLGAALFSWSRHIEQHSVPQEAIIGITFVVAAAAVILLLSRVAGGKEELENLLTGDILNVNSTDVLQRVGIFAALAIFYGAFHKKFALISTDYAAAAKAGIHVTFWDFLFYAAFAIVVVSFVRIAGVLLTFAYLIVPAVCAVMLADTWKSRLITGWVIALIASVAGLFASYKFDLPTGAAIVVACGILLVLASIVASIKGSRGPGRRVREEDRRAAAA
jgi:zinc/manganese transport system permease protein